MHQIIGLKQLRENVAEYARQVQKGRSFIVVKQSKPLFKITGIDREESDRHINKPKRSWEEIKKRLDWIASGGKQKTNLAKFVHDDRRRH